MKSHLKVTLFVCDERIPDKDEVASSNLARPTDFFIE